MDTLEDYLERRAPAHVGESAHADEDFAVEYALGNWPEMRYAATMLYTSGVLTKRQAE
jgi:hypothetical protein